MAVEGLETRSLLSLSPMITGPDHLTKVGSVVQPYVLSLSVTDPAASTPTVASWSIDWGDGNLQTVTGNPSSVSHTFAPSASPIASVAALNITATASDGTADYIARVVASDPSFGNGGIVTTNVSGGRDMTSSVLVQPDGKTVVAGNVSGAGWDFSVVRYNLDGSLDTTFGTGGRVILDISGNKNDGVATVLRQSDGKLLLVGGTATAGGYNSQAVALVRLNANGTVDTTYDTDGKVVTAFGSDLAVQSAVLQPDGRLLVTGSNNGAWFLLRYNTDGSLDTSFDGDGKAILDVSGRNDSRPFVALQPDGRIVVAGMSDAGNIGHILLARFLANGAPDTSFGGGSTGGVGGGGYLMSDFVSMYGWSYVGGVGVQSSGRIVVGGLGNGSFCVRGFLPSGAVDTSFGTSGVASYSAAINASWDTPGFTLQGGGDDGKIVLVGWKMDASASNPWNTGDFGTVRFSANGQLDPTFNDGKLLVTNVGAMDIATAVATADGKITVAGTTNLLNGYGEDFAVARYLGDTSVGVPVQVNALNAPEMVQTFTLSQTSVFLMWADTNIGETGYRVDRSTDGINFVTVASIPADYTWFYDSGLMPGQEYTYKISTFFGNSGSLSSTVSSTVSIPLPPGAPSAVTLQRISTTQVAVSWDAPTGGAPTTYTVFSSPDGLVFSPIATVSGTTRTYTDIPVTGATNPSYYVRSENSGGTATSAAVALNTAPPPPPVEPDWTPTGLTILQTTPTTVRFQFTCVDLGVILSATIKGVRDNNFHHGGDTLGTSTTHIHQIDNLEPATTYTLFITGSKNGVVQSGQPVTFTTPSIPDVRDPTTPPPVVDDYSFDAANIDAVFNVAVRGPYGPLSGPVPTGGDVRFSAHRTDDPYNVYGDGYISVLFDSMEDGVYRGQFMFMDQPGSHWNVATQVLTNNGLSEDLSAGEWVQDGELPEPLVISCANGPNNKARVSWSGGTFDDDIFDLSNSATVRVYRVFNGLVTPAGYTSRSAGYLDVDPGPNGSTFFAVYAWSGYSNFVASVPAKPRGALLFPLYQTGDRTVKVSWEDYANNETGYEIFRKRSSTTVWTKVAEVGADVESYVDQLPGGPLDWIQYYDYQVRAVNQGVESDPWIVRQTSGPLHPVDIDVDSNNKNGFESPDRTPQEEAAEDTFAGVGKIAEINTGDVDQDGIPDYADGYNFSSSSTADNQGTAGNHLVPVIVEVPDSADLSTLTLTFSNFIGNDQFPGSDPTQVRVSGSGPTLKYSLPTDGGPIRLWNKDGTELRNGKSILEGGNYLRHDVAYTAAQLGLTDTTRVLTLYAELLSTVTTSIGVMARWGGNNGTRQVTLQDSVKVTGYGVSLQEIGGAGGAGSAIKLSKASPVISVGTYFIDNLHLDSDLNTILGDVHLTGTVDDFTSDLSPSLEIKKLKILLNGQSQSEIVVNSQKANSPSSLLKAYDYSGTFTTTLSNVKLRAGVNKVNLSASNASGNEGTAEISLTVETKRELSISLAFPSDPFNTSCPIITATVSDAGGSPSTFTLQRLGVTSSVFQSYDLRVDLGVFNTNIFTSATDSRTVIINFPAAGAAYVPLVMTETGSNTSVLAGKLALELEPGRTNLQGLTLSAGAKQGVASGPGEFHPYTYSITGPQQLLSVLSTLQSGTVSLPLRYSTVFGGIYASYPDVNHPAVFLFQEKPRTPEQIAQGINSGEVLVTAGKYLTTLSGQGGPISFDYVHKFKLYDMSGRWIEERVPFITAGVSIAVDNNRDGTITFTGSDTTSVTKPFLFWLNDNRDIWGGDSTPEAISQEDVAVPDSAVSGIGSSIDASGASISNNSAAMNEVAKKDLEDFAQMGLAWSGSIESQITGFRLRLVSEDTSMALRVYASSRGAYADASSFSATAAVDDSQAIDDILDRDAWAGHLSGSTTVPGQLLTAGDQISWVGDGRIDLGVDAVTTNSGDHLLQLMFEGVTRGSGQVIFEAMNGSTVLSSSSFSLKLLPVKELYDHYSVSYGPYVTVSTKTLDQSASPLDVAHPVPTTAQVLGTNLERARFQEGANSQYLLLVHGWNMSENERINYAQTTFKRMHWAGYKGQIGMFDWPTETTVDATQDVGNFDRSEFAAWNSAVGLKNTLLSIRQTQLNGSGKLSVLAHSMGNIVTDEALHLAEPLYNADGPHPLPLADSVIMSQAAISANYFSGSRVVPSIYKPGTPSEFYGGVDLDPFSPNTPIAYSRPAFPSAGAIGGSAPRFASIGISAGKIFNYYNPDDYALTSWKMDQALKPTGYHTWELTGVVAPYTAAVYSWIDRGNVTFPIGTSGFSATPKPGYATSTGTNSTYEYNHTTGGLDRVSWVDQEYPFLNPETNAWESLFVWTEKSRTPLTYSTATAYEMFAFGASSYVNPMGLLPKSSVPGNVFANDTDLRTLLNSSGTTNWNTKSTGHGAQFNAAYVDVQKYWKNVAHDIGAVQ